MQNVLAHASKIPDQDSSDRDPAQVVARASDAGRDRLSLVPLPSLKARITPQEFARGARYTLYQGDARVVMSGLEDSSIDCIVTSPPYYGQRDYCEDGQIGLEANPKEYIAKLVAVFREAHRVLRSTGSLWIVMGDTYWSGKGRPHGPDIKQPRRRFLRPQDRSGLRPLCTPKQLLLIPHRLAIALQDEGWIVRNDIVWHKPNAMPDPASDRCAVAHEYVFHMVKARKYFFDVAKAQVPAKGQGRTKVAASVWTVSTSPSRKNHPAVFPESLVRLPIQASCPDEGVLLDPFCGSGTALVVGLATSHGIRAVGVDISPVALSGARQLLESVGP